MAFLSPYLDFLDTLPPCGTGIHRGGVSVGLLLLSDEYVAAKVRRLPINTPAVAYAALPTRPREDDDDDDDDRVLRPPCLMLPDT